MKELEGSSVLLLGYGEEGKSTHRYIAKHYPDKRIGIADKEKVTSVINNSSVLLHTGEKYLDSLVDYDVIVRSPGIPSSLIQLQESARRGQWVTSETNIFFSECSGKIIGITGTKGKSTTSGLISHILKQHFTDVHLVGNIGKPPLDYLNNANNASIFVMELSSYQLEDARYGPQIAVLLSIVPEHLDHHGTFDQYIKAKENIAQYQNSQDIIIFNPSHKISAQVAQKSQAEKFCFSLEKNPQTRCYVKDNRIFILDNNNQPQLVMSISEIPLLGRGNLENTLAAISVAFLMNVPLTTIYQTIKEFKSLPHRLEFVGEYQGIKFYNDSLATIPEAAIHALQTFGDEVETLIAGGYDRGLDFSELGKLIAVSQGLKTLILFPMTGDKIWNAVVKNQLLKNIKIHKYDVSSMQEAVKIAFTSTTRGKICLLSPAAASFGLFRNYEERGNLFKKLIVEESKNE